MQQVANAAAQDGKKKIKKIRIAKPALEPGIEAAAVAASDGSGAVDQHPANSKFARALGSTDFQTREKGLRALTRYLQQKTDLSEAVMAKLWKGLFFCFWHSDKAPVQAELAERLAAMMGSISEECAYTYFTAFLAAMRREWFNIDKLRLDKFLMLVRKFIYHMFLHMQQHDWRQDLLQKYTEYLQHHVLLPTGHSRHAMGLAYHLGDVYVPELRKAATASLQQQQAAEPVPVPAAALEVLLQPFCAAMAAADELAMVNRIKEGVMDTLVEEVQSPSEGAPLGALPVAEFASKLFDLGAQPSTRARNRAALYEVSDRLERSARKRQRREQPKQVKQQQQPAEQANGTAEPSSGKQQQGAAEAAAPHSSKKGRKEKGGKAAAAPAAAPAAEQPSEAAAAATPAPASARKRKAAAASGEEAKPAATTPAAPAAAPASSTPAPATGNKKAKALRTPQQQLRDSVAELQQEVQAKEGATPAPAGAVGKMQQQAAATPNGAAAAAPAVAAATPAAAAKKRSLQQAQQQQEEEAAPAPGTAAKATKAGATPAAAAAKTPAAKTPASEAAKTPASETAKTPGSEPSTKGKAQVQPSAKKAVRINLKKNLYFDFKGPVPDPEVRTPMTSRSKGGILKQVSKFVAAPKSAPPKVHGSAQEHRRQQQQGGTPKQGQASTPKQGGSNGKPNGRVTPKTAPRARAALFFQ